MTIRQFCNALEHPPAEIEALYDQEAASPVAAVQ
jgi:hypothetical protein